MKRILLLLGSLLWAAAAFSQEPPPDRLTVAFSDPARPGVLKASLMNGGMTIKAYDGKEVLVEARIRPEKPSRREMTDKKKMGMQRLAIISTGLTVEEEDNEMRIGAETMNRTVDLTIQVPKKISLKLSCLNDGDIKVEGVSGEIEVNNQNGAITITDVSGSVVAYAHNDDITVSFAKVEPDKAMSFVSWNGDVDVTFPPEVRAKAKMKTNNGEVYSDFEVKLEAAANRVEEDGRKEGGKYKLKVEKAVYGLINGGGPEMQFSTYNGDIYIRKGK
ncbi:MAG: hypothetical protein ALAOOOJD_04048 [bacterium]|nr:hypothetical protein [bacterium]